MPRSFRVTAYGQLPALCELKRETLAKGEIRLRISACGLNFADLLMVEGRYQDTPATPFTPGLEVAGEVIEISEGCGEISVGQRVAVFCGAGGLAEEGVFEAAACLPIPDGMPDDHAAGFQIAYGTSHLALTRRARLRAGERLLVLGAAGGVGLTAVEIGKAMGAHVTAVARGAEKCATAQAAGADEVLDSDLGLERLIAEVKGAGGADVVYDPVGGELFTLAMKSARREARILSIGFASGTVPLVAANHLLVKNIDLIGFYWGGYMKFAPDVLRESLNELMSLYEAGKICPHISHQLPFEQALEGLELLRERKSTGKVVITMG